MSSPALQTSLQDALQDPAVCSSLLSRIQSSLSGHSMRFMEVCGTHTVAIFRSGLRSLFPEGVEHLSGPGCPVCVTSASDVDLFLQAGECPGVVIATFGDLLRVPGRDGLSLKYLQAQRGNVEIVYSPLDAVALAQRLPDREIVFPGIGFETTAPAVAASILTARRLGLKNFSVLSLHKLVAPALKAILADPACRVDAFLLPGHVVTITGLAPFQFLAQDYGRPACAGGFEPADILLALANIAEQMRDGRADVANTYERAARSVGNPHARKLLEQVLEPADAVWRGLGHVTMSGLALREEFAEYDALRKLGLERRDIPDPAGCQCGAILRGVATPEECPLFGKKCTPLHPVGPCMVSTEGSCAAHYKYKGTSRG